MTYPKKCLRVYQSFSTYRFTSPYPPPPRRGISPPAGILSFFLYHPLPRQNKIMIRFRFQYKSDPPTQAIAMTGEEFKREVWGNQPQEVRVNGQIVSKLSTPICDSCNRSVTGDSIGFKIRRRFNCLNCIQELNFWEYMDLPDLKENNPSSLSPS